MHNYICPSTYTQSGRGIYPYDVIVSETSKEESFMHYANPMFPQTAGYSNVAPTSKMSNVAPAAKTANVGPVGGYGHHCQHQGYGGAWTTTGVILVLFILLVIISRAWAI